MWKVCLALSKVNMLNSNKKKFLVSSSLILFTISGCANKESTVEANTSTVSSYQMDTLNTTETTYIDDNYRTTYEICPYSFYDTNNDGIGDLNGITQKLDYIHTKMGFDEIWLTPINTASSYHKYDIIDYYSIDPDFGTMEDFETLVKECHAYNTNIILDLVINHTSIEHPYFKQASDYIQSLSDQQINSDDCKYVDYYNFTKEKKIGYEPLEGTDYYYEARFYSGMPDLNLDNQEVRNEIKDIITFWLEKKIDGFRLDATTSYYSDSQKDTINFLSWLNDTVKSIKKDAYLVGECWKDVNVISDYYTSGIDSFFNFPFSQGDGVIAKVVKGSMGAKYYGSSIEDIEEKYSSSNLSYIDAPFYTNHDTNRSAGYYSGDNSEAQTKLAGALNLLMGGNAFVYYGEEIGMKGSGEDPNKRMPYEWGEEEGMCNPPDGSTKVKMKYGTYTSQKDDSSSILNYYRHAIQLRNVYPIIARGKTQMIDTLSDDSICVLEKTSDVYDPLLIVINTSNEEKEVDLSSLEYSTLTNVLNTSEEQVKLEGTTLKIPSYDIAVLEHD